MKQQILKYDNELKFHYVSKGYWNETVHLDNVLGRKPYCSDGIRFYRFNQFDLEDLSKQKENASNSFKSVYDSVINHINENKEFCFYIYQDISDKDIEQIKRLEKEQEIK